MSYRLEQIDGKWVMHGDGFSRLATAPEVYVFAQLESLRRIVREALAEIEAVEG